jgi:hypothetical protein
MKHFFTLLLSTLALQASAQNAPSWTSAANLPITPAFMAQPATATDAAGNTYLAASFAGSVMLAPGTTLTSAGFQDGVLAKYSPTGSLLWYKQLQGSYNDSFQKVIIDASGKITLIGMASDGAQFGTATFSMSSFGLSSLVLAQIDAQGTVQYVREVGSGTLLTPASLASDAAGNYYLSGTFAVDATFGSITLTTPTTTTVVYDQFLVKMSSAGVVQWAQQGGSIALGTSATALPLSHLVADPSGNVYYVWTASPTVGGFGSVAMPAPKGDFDALVVKYNTQGTPQWAQRVGGSGADIATLAALDGSGRLVVPGISAPAGALTNPGTVGATTLTTGFATVLEPTAGTQVWSRDLQATAAGGYRHATTDAAGNIYLVGHFSGQGTVSGQALTGAGGIDALVVSYTSAGALRWTQKSGGAGDEVPTTVAIDGTGRLAVSGVFNNTGVFGTTTLTSTATAASTGTPFVAYMANVVTATRAGQAAPLALYPNPTSTASNVHLPALPAGSQLTIIDGVGRVLRREAAATTLPLAGLAPGFYVVQAIAPSGEQWASRLTVQ